MSVIYGDYPCVDPTTFRRECIANGLPLEPWYGRANGFDLKPVGKDPGKGWILLTRAQLDLVGLTSDHTLTFSGETTATAVSLVTITLLSAQCCSPGAPADPNAVYLCTLTDTRHHLAKIPVNTAYNVVSADGSGYLTQTKNAGTAWTWQQVVQDLATTLGIGTQTLPFTPDGTPENLAYWGGNAWDAIHDVLDRLACGLEYSPTAGTFSIVRLGVADATSDAALAALDAETGRRLWDIEAEDPVRAWRPEKVRVQFLRRPRPTDGSSPIYVVDVTLTATSGVKSGTYATIDDDNAALGATGTPSNSAALATRAAERAADWLRKRLGDAPLFKCYRDFLPGVVRDVPGSAVESIRLDDCGGPMRTEVRAGPNRLIENWRPLADLPPWVPPEVAVPVQLTGTYNATTGYPWKRLDLDYATPGFLDGSPASTGTALFEVYGYQGFASGQRLLMWPDADGDGWMCQRGGTPSPLTTKGDIWGFSTVDARIPVGTNDYVLTAASGETLGVKWAVVPGAGTTMPVWSKVTVSHTDLQTAAVTYDFVVHTLVAKGVIHSVVVKTATAFAGTGITSYDITIGDNIGSYNDIIDGYNVFAAVSDTNYIWEGSFAHGLPRPYSFAGTRSITLRATANVNLNNSTAGSLEIWFLLSVLP